MSIFLLSKEERGIVVFHFWKSLKYILRLILSFSLIILGFALQYYDSFYIGLTIVFIGNSLLLVKGYNNSVDLDAFKDGAEWVETSWENIENILTLDKKRKKWDDSFFEVSNNLGCIVFVISIAILFFLYSYNVIGHEKLTLIFISNIAILFYPHWLSGLRLTTRTPNLVEKIKHFNSVLNSFENTFTNDEIIYLVQVMGKKQKIPNDLKIKIKFKNQAENFQGVYVQISLNNVDGKKYPYLYVVLVANKGFGLKSYFSSISCSNRVIKEFDITNDVEIIVIRQNTKLTAKGYYTNKKESIRIIEDGINAARIINQQK